MNKTLYSGILIILGFMLMSTAQVPAQTTVQNPGTYISETSAWAPSSLDPATNYETQGGGVVQLVYEGLLRYANNSLNTLTDSLAYTNYTISSDGLTYTFTVKSGITFALQSGETVGQPLNAYVMQYSMQRAILMNDPQGGCPYTIDPFIVGAPDMLSYGNQTSIDAFLASQSIKALDANHLQITINQNFLGFIQALQFTATYAVSPKAIIDNEPTAYTTNTSDATFGMTSLAKFFPGMSNATILANLGLPSNYDVANSGVVANAPANAGAPNEYMWLADHSAGTGPYIVTINAQGSGATLTENPNWWNFASRPTNNRISTVIWKEVPETNSRILDLKAGSTDSGAVPYSSLNQVIDTNTLQPLYPGLAVHTHDTINNEYIGFNMFPGNASNTPNIVQSSASNYSIMAGGQADNYLNLKMYTWNNATGGAQMADPVNPFTALLFREAFAYAYDYGTYIQNSLAGFAIRMQGAIPKGLLGAQQDLIANGYIPQYDPVTAKALFQQVGWAGTITLTYNSGSTGRAESANLLKNTIESLNVGISINVQAIAWSQFLTYIFSGQGALWQLGWAPDYADAHDYTVPYYANEADGGFFSAIQGYDNPYVSSLVLAGAAATTPVARNAIYAQMEHNATQDYPYIYIDQAQSVGVTRDWIYGIDDPMTNSQSPMAWYYSFQWLTKSATPPPTSTSTTTTTATSSSSGTTSTSVSTSSSTPASSSTSAAATSSSASGQTPGFEVIAILGLAAVGLFEIRRNRKNN